MKNFFVPLRLRVLNDPAMHYRVREHKSPETQLLIHLPRWNELVVHVMSVKLDELGVDMLKVVVLVVGRRLESYMAPRCPVRDVSQYRDMITLVSRHTFWLSSGLELGLRGRSRTATVELSQPVFHSRSQRNGEVSS